jgi:Protein of unknown function (DUF4240)
MDLTGFWHLIEKTKADSKGDSDKQAELIVEQLSLMAIEEIITFEHIHNELMGRAYRRDLWNAAYIIDCGCSDDGFMDFRAWLIGQGQAIFNEALNDPESLVDVIEIGQETKVEALLYVAYHAYERKQVNNPSISHSLPQLIEDEINTDLMQEEWQKSLEAKYPKLHAKFGDCSGWLKFFDKK